MAVYEGERADAVIEALRIDITPQEDAAYEAADADLAVELEEELQQTTPLSPIEAVGGTSVIRRVDGGDRVVRRGEGLLVAAYVASLPSDVEFGRNFTPAGVTDLYIRHPDGGELIEAKSVETHLYVRQALAQLLDYAPAIQPTPRLVSALFPRRPTLRGIRLLHRYGIDCIYRTGPGQYQRLEAPASARERLGSALTGS